MLVSGYIGSIVVARILDSSKRYKLMMMLCTLLFLTVQILFTYFVQMRTIWLYHIMFALLGIAGKTGMNLTTQYGIELTYPQSVPTMAGMTTLVGNILAIVITQTGQSLILSRGEQAANIWFCTVLLVAAVLQLLVTEDLRRLRANQPDANSTGGQ